VARVVVGCGRGNESPDVMWLSSEGVRLATNGSVAPIRDEMEPPVQRVHDQFIEKGGRFYVCPICFNERELNETDLVDNAELKGATPLMDFVADGATVFNY
jgi:predicted peroxiredoxin